MLYKHITTLYLICFQALILCGQNHIEPVLSYSFENGEAMDEIGHSELILQKNTTLYNDEVKGSVLRFSSTEKSYAAFTENVLNYDSCSISFSFYWENMDAGSWHQLFEIFDAQTNNNVFFTPQNGWGGNQSSLISDNKEYEIYEAVNARSLEKEVWTHITITFQDRLCTIYYNGEEVAKNYISVPLTAVNADSLFLGGNPHRSDNFYISARLDDIKVFDKALAYNQVLALSNNEVIPAPESRGTDWNVSGDAVTLEINLADKKQTIQNFGSSDGWNTQLIGKHWPEEQKEKLAELLFSAEKDENGNPKGIGLSAWRFNIGAGTAEQGESSRISNAARRTEGFLNTDGETYDWNKQIGQQWFLKKAAIDYDIHHIIGWQNSPPVPFTEKNLGFRDFGAPMSTILKEEHFDDFAGFLADVIEHFGEEGITFDYISPLNEPQYGWSPTENGGNVSQEGTPWTNDEIFKVSEAIDEVFNQRNIDTKFFLSETASISHMVGGNGHASNQLNKFWNEFSSLNLKDKTSFANVVSFHSYWHDYGNELVNQRRNFQVMAEQLSPAPEIWQTEYSLLGEGYRSGYPSNYKLSEMESGLALAKVIISDLNLLNVTGWQWWTTFEKGKHGGEARFSLIEALTKADLSEGSFHLNKLFYTFGQFSHFIRPGMERVTTERSDNLSIFEEPDDVMFSAYTNESEEQFVLVAANITNEAREVKLTLKNSNNKVFKHQAFYLTDDYTGLAKQNVDMTNDALIIPAKSIVTFTADIETVSSVQDGTANSSFDAWYNAQQNQIEISLNKNTEVKDVKLYNVSGQIMKTLAVENSSSELYLSAENLPSGIYLVSIASHKNIETTLVNLIKN